LVCFQIQEPIYFLGKFAFAFFLWRWLSHLEPVDSIQCDRPSFFVIFSSQTIGLLWLIAMVVWLFPKRQNKSYLQI
jgi:hypothetical protein